MTEPVSPIGGPRRVSAGDPGKNGYRRAAGEAAPEDRTLPVVIDPQPKLEPPRSRRGAFAAFAAQMMGGGQKRGLRGGQETLDKARTTYLETEWSGPADRRPRPGRITKTEV